MKQSQSQTQDEKRLLRMLKNDPQQGMVLLMEQYTGIIWKIVSRYLDNPEDRKECVNETFARFYFQREKYDPRKASLALYLTTIASRIAISRYRKEERQRAEALNEETAAAVDRRITRAELKEDLEQAMDSLRPDELQIIRMKYYGGMTIREIADSLNLPYETVKKRHHRSVRKIRRSLLLTLILLALVLLTACTYNVLRYYRIVPDLPEIWRMITGEGDADEETDGGDVKPLVIPDGTGNRSAPDRTPEENVSEENASEIQGQRETAGAEPVIEADAEGSVTEQTMEESQEPLLQWAADYGIVMEEQSVPYTLAKQASGRGEYTVSTLQSAVYDGTWLLAEIQVEVDTEAVEAAGIELDEWSGYAAVCPNFETLKYADQSCRKATGSYPQDYLNPVMTYQCAFLTEEAFPIEGEPLELELSSAHTFTGADLNMSESISFTMVPTESVEPVEYVISVDENHALAVFPELTEDGLSVSVNPITLGGIYELLPSLLYGSYGQLYRKSSLTVTGADGTETEGTCLQYSPNSPSQYYEWEFAGIGAGEYTLTIPYLLYRVTATEAFDELEIQADLLEGVWDEQEHAIPGGSIAIESITPIECEAGDLVGGYLIASGNPDVRYWNVRLRVTSDDPAFPIQGIFPSGKLKAMPVDSSTGGSGSSMNFGGSSSSVDYGDHDIREIAEAGRDGRLTGPVSGTVDRIVSCNLNAWDASDFRILFEKYNGPNRINYYQAADLKISFTVE